MNYYEIAKTAYCTEGDQWDCRCCEMCEYLENHNFDASACREKLIVELVKIIDKYKSMTVLEKQSTESGSACQTQMGTIIVAACAEKVSKGS